MKAKCVGRCQMFYLLCVAASPLNSQRMAVRETRPEAGTINWGLGPAFWRTQHTKSHTTSSRSLYSIQILELIKKNSQCVHVLVCFVCVCSCAFLCHLYGTGGALRVLEFVLSSAACFCLLRITCWSFCFTTELATAPVNQ